MLDMAGVPAAMPPKTPEPANGDDPAMRAGELAPAAPMPPEALDPSDPDPESTEVALGFDEAVASRRPRRVWRWIVTTLFVLLFLVAVAGAALWATDYEVTADVEDTRCDLGEVTVRTRQLGVRHTVQEVPPTQCLLVEPGDFVQYRIRSQRTTLYDATGDCVYDSATGPC
jgi:hypothetical protein